MIRDYDFGQNGGAAREGPVAPARRDVMRGDVGGGGDFETFDKLEKVTELLR
jgi:hypothetical protein